MRSASSTLSSGPSTSETVAAAAITASGLCRAFGTVKSAKWAIYDVNFEVTPGEFVSIVGPSGCGKSTILNLLAGTTKPSTGTLLFNGTQLRGINTDVVYQTQHDTLLPWRTVLGNVLLPLQLAGYPRDERIPRARMLIDLVRLLDFESYYPNRLSGGMRTRANLARTLARPSGCWLMDEPFAALDAQLKLVLQQQLCELSERFCPSVLFVTHDLQEAIALSDRVLVMSGSPARILADIAISFSRPRNVVDLRLHPEFGKLESEIWSLLKPGSNN